VLVVALICGAFVVMVLSEDHRGEVIATLGCCVALAAVGYLRQRRA